MYKMNSEYNDGRWNNRAVIGKIEADKKTSISVSREEGSRLLMRPKCKTAKRNESVEEEMRKANR